MSSSELPVSAPQQQRGIRRTVTAILTVIVVFTVLFFWRIVRD